MKQPWLKKKEKRKRSSRSTYLFTRIMYIRVWYIGVSTGFLKKNKGIPVSYFREPKGTHKSTQYSIS